MNEVHVDATVPAEASRFTHGLVVFHDPASVIIHFQPGSLPRLLTLRTMASDHAQVTMLRYAQPHNSHVGHFVKPRLAQRRTVR